MIDIDKWQEIISSLKKQKLRTGLTAFGVFWGIFMLVILLGFGTGFGLKIESVFGDAKNMLVIWSANSTQMPYKGLGKGRQINLIQEDVDAIREKLKNIKLIDGVNGLGSQYIVHNNNGGSFNVMGSHANWEAIEFLRIVEGRYINQLDEVDNRKVVVIGSRTKDILFKNDTNAIGKTIEIKGVSFRIIGIYATTSVDDSDQQQNTTLYLPNSTLRQSFNQMTEFQYLIYQPIDSVSAKDVDKQVRHLLSERKKIHPDDKGVLGGFSMEENYKRDKSLVVGIIGFSWMVAIGTIIAGVIGVGNIMLVVVKERTREIGLRKAMGATPTNISLMIMHESLVITLTAGYSGLVAGVFMLEAIKVILIKLGQGSGMFSSPYIDIGTAFTALCVLVFCGVAAAVLPAMKAAAVNPIIALQDE